MLVDTGQCTLLRTQENIAADKDIEDKIKRNTKLINYFRNFNLDIKMCAFTDRLKTGLCRAGHFALHTILALDWIPGQPEPRDYTPTCCMLQIVTYITTFTSVVTVPLL